MIILKTNPISEYDQSYIYVTGLEISFTKEYLSINVLSREKEWKYYTCTSFSMVLS